MIKIDHVLPADIEKTSFATIDKELKEMGKTVSEDLVKVVYRVIHTTADFEYADTMTFSDSVQDKLKEAISNGAHIITDTTMALSGINKKTLARFGGEAHCFIADEDVAASAKERQVTRATVSMEKAMKMEVPLIFAIGNAPTALITLYEAIEKGYKPAGIVGVPVGFVNVVQAKELIMSTKVPYIVNKGRKGGSNVAAAICNAILYQMV